MQCVAHQVCVVESKMSDSDLSKISDAQTDSDSFKYVNEFGCQQFSQLAIDENRGTQHEFSVSIKVSK